MHYTIIFVPHPSPQIKKPQPLTNGQWFTQSKKRTTVHNLHVQNNILLVYFLQLKLKKEMSHSQKDNIWLLQGPESIIFAFCQVSMLCYPGIYISIHMNPYTVNFNKIKKK